MQSSPTHCYGHTLSFDCHLHTQNTLKHSLSSTNLSIIQSINEYIQNSCEMPRDWPSVWWIYNIRPTKMRIQMKVAITSGFWLFTKFIVSKSRFVVYMCILRDQPIYVHEPETQRSNKCKQRAKEQESKRERETNEHLVVDVHFIAFAYKWVATKLSIPCVWSFERYWKKTTARNFLPVDSRLCAFIYRWTSNTVLVLHWKATAHELHAHTHAQIVAKRWIENERKRECTCISNIWMRDKKAKKSVQCVCVCLWS